MTSSDETGAPSLSKTTSRYSFPIFVFVVVVFVAARLWQLTASCLWFDEIFSIHAARHGWKQMFQFVAADLIHPPLFYVVLKIWIAVGGESLLWLRLLPVVMSVAAIVPLVFLCRALRLTTFQTNFTVGLLAVNGYLIKYSHEIRMYSLLFFLTCMSLWLFVKFTAAESKVSRVLPALTVVNLLLVYSHYYGWLVVFVEVILISFVRRERGTKLRLTSLLLGFLYLPWLYLMTLAKEPGRGLAQNIGWVTRPGLSSVIELFTLWNIPFFYRQSSLGSINDVWSFYLSLLGFGVPIGILIWRTARGQNTDRSLIWLLATFCLLPIVLVGVLSWVSPYSVWGTRHLIITSVPYAILAALALSKLSLGWLRTGCFVLIGGWVALNGFVTVVKRPPKLTWCNWESLAQQVAQVEGNSSAPVQIYAFEDLVAYHVWFAFESAARQSGHSNNFHLHVVKGVPGLLEDPAYFLPRRFYEIETQDGANFKGDTIWLAFRDTQWNPARPPLTLIADQGFETGRIFTMRAQGQESFLVEVRRKGQMQ